MNIKITLPIIIFLFLSISVFGQKNLNDSINSGILEFSQEQLSRMTPEQEGVVLKNLQQIMLNNLKAESEKLDTEIEKQIKNL